MPSSISLPQVFLNIASAYPQILLFLYAASYACGAFAAFMALLHMARQHGGGSKAAINDNSWAWGLGVAIVFFALPSAIDSAATQIFGSTPQSPMAYATSSFDKRAPVLAPLAGALQLFGMWFAMSGLLTLRRFGINGYQSGVTPGKGFTKIIAGVLLVNLDSLLRVISSVTGLNVGAGLFN